jgi:Glycosyl hydrolase family 47
MVPGGEDILFPGSIWVPDGKLEDASINPEAQHLGCFAGGMVAIAAKIFRNDNELNLARRLMEGCLWAYENMPQGIMPEVMHMTPCPTNDCEWDEKAWFEAVAMKHLDELSTTSTIQNERLPRGVATVDDTRYILRYVNSYLYQLSAYKTQTRSHRVCFHHVSYFWRQITSRSSMEYVQLHYIKNKDRNCTCSSD